MMPKDEAAAAALPDATGTRTGGSANPSRDMGKFSFLQRFYFNEFMSAVIVEFIGTFLLVLTVPLSSLNNPEMAPFSVGFMLMSLVFSFGYMSGGHMNPMVSFAVFLSTANFGKARMLFYFIAQMLGGVAAAFYCVLIHGRDFPVPNMGLDFVQMLRGILAESVFTFVLTSVVLHVAVSKQRNNNFYGFAIGSAVLVGGLTCGSISGGAFNPAVATSLIVVRCFISFSESGCTPMASLWVYWASEAVGSIVGTILYLAVQNVEERF
ncbi:aquaporin [Trypanosoma grayi]|uniref:aquaporin n=1 Tax=Trypanosoma grayi TaxID=71804 RepID=UPI0004F47870|nr:aquaporin [Trypanosoma grayi]KEG11248.1 aquaporin [Trypanosoma grayi]